jgi:hypothetical protein
MGMAEDAHVRCKVTHMGQTLGIASTEAQSESVARNASAMKAIAEVEDWDGSAEYGLHCRTR